MQQCRNYVAIQNKNLVFINSNLEKHKDFFKRYYIRSDKYGSNFTRTVTKMKNTAISMILPKQQELVGNSFTNLFLKKI